MRLNTMAKFIPEHEFGESLVTSRKEPIITRHGTQINQKGELVDGSYQIDTEDTIKLLSWLAEKAPLMQSTTSLHKSYKDMRTSLLEILEAVSE